MPLTSYTVDEKQVALIRLEREEARNAINTADAGGDARPPRPREGGRGGARPGDLLQRPPRPLRRRRRPRGARRGGQGPPDGALRPALRRADGFPKPTVAACHGAVVGGGAEIAVACDLRVGGSNLRMRFPGAELGVPVGPARLVTLCGLATAKYLLLTSRNVSADEALRMGLVHRVAPAAGTEDAALDLAAEVAGPPARGGRPPQGDAASLGRGGRALRRRGPRPGRVAAHRARACRTATAARRDPDLLNGKVRCLVGIIPFGNAAMSPVLSSSVGPSEISIRASPSSTTKTWRAGSVHTATGSPPFGNRLNPARTSPLSKSTCSSASPPISSSGWKSVVETLETKTPGWTSMDSPSIALSRSSAQRAPISRSGMARR